MQGHAAAAYEQNIGHMLEEGSPNPFTRQNWFACCNTVSTAHCVAPAAWRSITHNALVAVCGQLQDYNSDKHIV
jgi:hypothetical protein